MGSIDFLTLKKLFAYNLNFFFIFTQPNTPVLIILVTLFPTNREQNFIQGFV